MPSKAAQLSQALSEAGFVNRKAFKQRAIRLYQHTPGKEMPKPGGERGWFLYYADARAHDRRRYKFEVRTNSNADALEAQDIAKRVVPEAYSWLSPSGQRTTIEWTE